MPDIYMYTISWYFCFLYLTKRKKNLYTIIEISYKLIKKKLINTYEGLKKIKDMYLNKYLHVYIFLNKKYFLNL